MQETETQVGVNEDVLRGVDWTRKNRAVTPALDFSSDHGAAMVSVPLFLRESGGAMAASKSYTVLALADGRRLCIKTADLPLRIAAMPTFVSQESRWREEELRGFLEGTYTVPPVADLFAKLIVVIDKYLDITQTESRLLACWIFTSYWFPLWPALGYLKCEGPFSSGKSRLLTLLGHLAFNPINMANVTAAALCRVCGRATCLIDEAESLGGPSQRDLRLILNAGYRQEGGEVIRCAGRGRLIRWPVYGPKAIGSITGLDDVLGSRAITLKMHPSINQAKTSLRLDESAEDFAGLRAGLYATCLLNWRGVITGQVGIDGLSNRRLEIFLPILQVAQFVDPTGALAAELAAYATRSTGPTIPPVAMTPEERKVAEAVAGLPNGGPDQWLTSNQIRDAVLGRFPELSTMSTAALGLILARHRLWAQRRHTPAGKVYLLDGTRAAVLAAMTPA